MQFPRQKMRFTTSYGGDRSEEGWLLLEIRDVDLEGVSQIAIRLADVLALQAQGDQQDEALKRARALLGGGEQE
jgi:hypothetical protein